MPRPAVQLPVQHTRQAPPPTVNHRVPSEAVYGTPRVTKGPGLSSSTSRGDHADKARRQRTTLAQAAQRSDVRTWKSRRGLKRGLQSTGLIESSQNGCIESQAGHSACDAAAPQLCTAKQCTHHIVHSTKGGCGVLIQRNIAKPRRQGPTTTAAPSTHCNNRTRGANTKTVARTQGGVLERDTLHEVVRPILEGAELVA